MRASASARLPFITLKKPNIARAVKGTATTQSGAGALAQCGVGGGYPHRHEQRGQSKSHHRWSGLPERPTAATTMNTHMTEASARANGTSATHRATIMAREHPVLAR